LGSEPARLAEIPAGARVFIDANIFIYHFAGASEECTQFLERCERGELLGITAVHTLLEVLHRLMMIEAVAEGLVEPGGVARRLREQPEVVRRLKRYQEQGEAILEMGLEVLPLEPELIALSGRYRREYGLLVNDSLTAALVAGLGLEGLATADEDFRRLREEFPLYVPEKIALR